MSRNGYAPQSFFALVPMFGLAFDPMLAQFDTSPDENEVHLRRRGRREGRGHRGLLGGRATSWWASARW